MYKDYFRMHSDAFSNQPLPGLFFTSKSHQSVWSCLVSEINRYEPYLLVTGEYGTGKTTLCLKLVRALKKNGTIPFLYVATPNYDYATILQRIAARLGLAVEGEGGSLLQDRIFQHYEKEQPQKGLILILDDVQDMGMATLANLRLLANFSHDGFFPFRLILFAHPSFLPRLTSQVLQALNQRIRRRMQLAPLSLSETREYVYFRLYQAGAAGTPFFAEDALVLLHAYSRGIPRLINNICDVCLVTAASRGVAVIDGGTLTDAARYLQAEPLGTPEQLPGTRPLPPLSPVAGAKQVIVKIADEVPASPEKQPPAPEPPTPVTAGEATRQERSPEETGTNFAEEFGALEPSVDIPAAGRKRSKFVWLVVIVAVFLVSMLMMILLDVKSVFNGLM